ncbi:tRNA lysidine(34) synthetase TilS [Bosea sp. (in: a-proteobacteria)]|uniref:tRNA lysidine(34) synthetase TilS n=1 Tax=Bosea sp. (in: a-proteobacteria) TaxID=1871050 RepID=UPI002DDD2CD1|nr:tRNA lysidine(34) synthetase TilS [Bosea sp. (in: a-proteobacteria)]HEV2511375.1 tRNA lysidine(34) synthetase TilS [Bosea sp. (in: a-proteobacteria)]
MTAAPAEPADSEPLTAAEADTLFRPLAGEDALIVAVSGGPDSIALLALLAEWAGLGRPRLLAVTIDHGLRPEAAQEAVMVGELCARLGVEHRTRRWQGPKPQAGVQEKARSARYALLAEEARVPGATAIVTAHTADDQAETLLMRMAAGSGLAGLAGMAPRSAVNGIVLARPLLGIAKFRLVATCEARGLPFIRDPSNDDPRFARIRWRGMLPVLAREGLTVGRLGQLAHRLARADEALDRLAARALASVPAGDEDGKRWFDFARLCGEPEEIAIRSLGLALAAAQDGEAQASVPPRLARLEDCAKVLIAAAREGRALRRTLGGFRLSLAGDGVLTLMREGERRRGVHPATV